jgi:creatinine amidohydrolase
MPIFTDALTEEVCLEHMRPEQVARARQRRPAIYVPFGSIEWHGRQNPVGLDGTKAHELLVGLAARSGGVVYPTVFLGAGGGHCEYTSSYMVGQAPMVQIVGELLRHFQRDGYRQAILLCGHYPNRGQYVEPAVKAYLEAGGRMRILALTEHQAPGVGGDHAAKHETSAMLYLHPERVDLSAIAGPPQDFGPADKTINWMADEYKDHPCYGIVGIDPRAHASAEVGRENAQRLIEHLAKWLDEGAGTPEDER